MYWCASLVTVATAVSLIVPASTQAATVTAFESSPFQAVYRAAPGEANDLRVFSVDHELLFTDTAPLGVIGDFCALQAPGQVACQNPGTSVEAHMDDRDDNARVTVSSTGTIWGGGGDDVLAADSFGGRTIVYGEGGDDTVTAGGEGGQIADGGAGDDIVHAGGFAPAASGFGGPGDDLITFAGHFSGIATVDGGPGDDTLSIQPGHRGTASGGPGIDTVFVNDMPATSSPAPAGIELSGGPGADSLGGGPFADTVHGGPGNDTIDVRGGGSDTVTCGSGHDVVRHDAADTIAADCESALPAP